MRDFWDFCRDAAVGIMFDAAPLEGVRGFLGAALGLPVNRREKRAAK